MTGALSELAGSGPLLREDEAQGLASAFASTGQAGKRERASGALDGAQAILAASAGRRIRTFLYMVTGLLAFLELPGLWIAWGQWIYTAGIWLSNPILGIQASSLSADQSPEKLPDKLAFFVAALVGMLLVAIVVIAYENLVLFTFWREWSAVETDAMFGRAVGRGNVWLKLVFLTASIVVPALVVVSVLTGFAAPSSEGGQGDGVAIVWFDVLKWLLGAGDDRVLGEVATILSVVTWALAWMGLLVSLAIALVGAYLCGLGPRFLRDWEQRYGQSEDPQTIKEMMIRTRLVRRLEQMANGRTIAWLAGLVVLFYLVFFLLSSQLTQHVTAHHLEGYQPLEYPIFNFPTPQKIFETITDYDNEGRTLYILSCSILDTIFPLAYGLLMALIILWVSNKVTGGKPPGYVRFVAVLPLIMATFDYLENASILTMLTRYPREFTVLEQALPILTDVKYAMLPVTAAALLVALLVRVVTRPAAVRA